MADWNGDALRRLLASAECFNERVMFAPKLIPYTGDDAWIEPTLLDLKRCLTSDSPPHASIDCEYCGYAEARKLCSLATNKCL